MELKKELKVEEEHDNQSIIKRITKVKLGLNQIGADYVPKEPYKIKKRVV